MRCAAFTQDGRELPAEIETVLHGDVHALARFRAVGVAGIAGNEHMRQACRDGLVRYVVELVAQPLADLVDRPPRDLLHVERVGGENAARRRDQVVVADVAIGNPFAGFELVEFDVQPEQIAAFPRNDDDAAVVGGLDQRLEAHVRKVGHGQHIHHAPGVVGGIAMQRAPDALAHGAARPVAAHDITRPDGFALALVRGIDALEFRGHRIGCRIAAGRGPEIDLEIEQPPRVVRRELRRRLAHDVEEEIVHARLVQDDMREFGEPILDVLDTAAAGDRLRPDCVRLPEHRLVDPVALLQHPFREAEGVEHLDGAAGDAVSLAAEQGPRLLFDNAGLDVGKGGQLGRQRQAGRPAADDEDIDLFRDRAGASGRDMPLRGIRNLRIAGCVSVQMKLHETSSCRAVVLRWSRSGPAETSGSRRARRVMSHNAKRALRAT